MRCIYCGERAARACLVRHGRACVTAQGERSRRLTREEQDREVLEVMAYLCR